MPISIERAPNLPLQPQSPPGQIEAQTIADCYDWLSFHRLWGELKAETLNSLAHSLQLLKVESGTDIYRDGQAPAGLYLLKWGSVEIYRFSQVGKTHMLYRSAGEMFGYVPLLEGRGEACYRASAIALSPSEIWFLDQANFQQLITDHPDIQSIFNRLLAQDLVNFAQRIAKEQARIQGLQSYICPVPTQATLIGRSKASTKLAQQIEAAAEDTQPVVFQAPPGTGKTFLAGYIHAHSGLKDRPFAQLDCAQLPRTETGGINTDALFGKVGGPIGIIELLERGTLLIDNVQLLSEGDCDRILQYLRTGTLLPNPDLETPATPAESWVRLILASPQKLPLSGVAAHAIKLFSLPQRKEDIPAFAQHFLARFSREQGRATLQLDQANTRRLLSYSYPGNLAELAGLLKRAVSMTPQGQTVIPEQTLWSVQSPKNAFRIDLLNQFPWLRQLLLSDWWPERFWIVIMALFIPVTLMGYIGPQSREASMTLNFFWAWWWPVYLFLFVFVGRLWCAVCPFMITGEWIRKLSLLIWPRQLLPWPTRWLNRWGAWILFAGFVAIYLWEKLWDLPHTAYLSAWLLVIITAGAVIGSVIYERRLWCRYLCPIGGMNGMFAKLSMIEVRSTQQVCGSQCSTFGCYKGSDATPVEFAHALPTEGQATDGCPLYSHPAQLQDNRDCILCMTCLKACPHRSVQLNLRFPASDLLENHQGNWPEVALLLLLLGGVFMHHDHQILDWFGWGNLPVDADHLLLGSAIASLLLSIPAILTVLTHAIARLFDRELPDYQTVIYAYLPLTLAANLAHYTPAAMTEAGQILPVIARTFGYSGIGLPTLT
ncbi:MAG: cyclic nucleotide-binding domain-containing protein, partial [Thermosynechococcaceae cyanobacterium]